MHGILDGHGYSGLSNLRIKQLPALAFMIDKKAIAVRKGPFRNRNGLFLWAVPVIKLA
jgi:hypothetical protein